MSGPGNGGGSTGEAFCPQDILSFEDALARERAMLAGISGASSATSRFLVWRTEQALIVPRGMPQRAGFEQASHAAQALGWPVHERDTGGDLTPQSPGMINISMVFRDEAPAPSIARAYDRLLTPVLEFLDKEMGIPAYASAIAGSFCDGAYNVAFAGRKLGGTAQRWRLARTKEGAQGGANVLAHVALICDMPLSGAIAAINEFYRLCAIGKHIDASRHISLADIVGTDKARPAQVASAIARFLDGRRI